MLQQRNQAGDKPTNTMPKRRYSDTERATTLAVLDSNGGNLSRTQREVGVPRTTLREWRDGRHHGEVADIRQEKRLELADLFEQFIRDVFEYGLTEEKIKAASLKELMIAAGIAVDKLILLRGQTPDESQKQPVNVFIQTHLGSDRLPEF